MAPLPLPAQYSEDRVTVFDATTGDIVSVFGGTSGVADGQLKRACGLCVTANGAHVAVADAGNRRVSVFEAKTGTWAAPRWWCCAVWRDLTNIKWPP